MDESANDFENYVCFRNMENDSIRKTHNNSADSPSKRIIQKVSCSTGYTPFKFEPVLKVYHEPIIRNKKTQANWWQ